MIIVARPRNLSQLSLICLPVGFVTWLVCQSLSISSNWSHLYWQSLWLSGRFRLLLECSDWLEKGVLVEFLLDIFDKICVIFPVIFATWCKAYFAQVGELFAQKSCRVYSWTSILCFWSSGQRKRKHGLSSLWTATWRNIASISAESTIWSSWKQKYFRSDTVTGLVQREVCLSRLHHGTFLRRCELFWFSRVCEDWWQDDVASTTEVCLSFRSTQPVQICRHNHLSHQCQLCPDNTFATYYLSLGVVLGTWVAR